MKTFYVLYIPKQNQFFKINQKGYNDLIPDENASISRTQ